MSAITQNDVQQVETANRKGVMNSFLRILKYSLVRLISLLFSVVVAIFLTILIANMGGYVDQIRMGEIRETVVQSVRGNQSNRDLPPEQFQKLVNDLVFQEAHSQGLDQPLMLRAVRYMKKALTLNLGNALRMTSDSGSKQVRVIILERLPPTLLLWGVSGLLLFFVEISVALSISRKYGTWVDKFFVSMAPFSTSPGWFFGIFLILIFASYFRVLPFGGMVDAPIPKTTLGYGLSLAKHMILPTMSLVLTSFFLNVYQWRTFFLIYSSEEYVDIAKAKGLSARAIERDYVLRPTLPNIITGFALTLIALWLGGPITETIFNWPGLGRAFYQAVQFYDTPVILGQTVIYAYMLAFTVFALDYIYALVDPRVKIGQGGEQYMKEIKRSFRELLRYPTAIASMVMIFIAVLLSAYTMITIPYNEAIRLWRGSEDDWYQYPKQAAPAWLNQFNEKKQPVSFFLDSTDPKPSAHGTVTRDVQKREDGTSKVTISYTFDYQYDDFPQDIILYTDVKNTTKKPLVGVTWITPDRRKINMASYSVAQRNVYRISQDDKLARILRATNPIEGLFANPASETPVPLKGTYQLVVATSLFEPDASADVELVLHGTLYGLAGTDFKRRDLMIPLMWGMPIALAFGLLAALGTTVTTLVIAAIGTWYGGWVDETIQRITEINSVLPFFPILIMIGTFYSRSIWLILGATIVLNIFGLGIKNFRAIFLQIKEAPYIEAARSYGASDGRIIIRYLTPRVIPLLIPQLVTLVPGYVFLEAGLAVLGLGDPFMPTWGKVIDDARTNGALFEGLYYWILEPAVLLLITGLAFALLGFALDRVFNPKLREM